jgi:5-methylcytosine-specific restriction endonuclease McrA
MGNDAMTRSAPHPCPICRTKTRREGLCEACARARPRKAEDRERNARQPWRAIYRSEAWRKLSRQTLLEEPVCRRCGRPSEVADHVVPIGPPFWGAPLDRSNTQGLCRGCNVAKGAEDRSAARAARKGGRQ